MLGAEGLVRRPFWSGLINTFAEETQGMIFFSSMHWDAWEIPMTSQEVYCVWTTEDHSANWRSL